MLYTTYYQSPVGQILLAAKDDALVGAWFENQKYFLGSLKDEQTEQADYPLLLQVQSWLDRYFAGEKPENSELKLAPGGSEFRRAVLELLCQIPYGQVTTYGEISKKIAAKFGRKHMSAQAVGGAVGHNPISIIIPCHRVLGSGGSLTGYAGGLDKKRWLLMHEGAEAAMY
ncbi:methylated-DNA--[protein]-cysteine S-methyltransferase [Blautia schinkii]|nr:methylated-DNA--[protein]-cysteine S-methyltransferase [Blautia schinkii]